MDTGDNQKFPGWWTVPLLLALAVAPLAGQGIGVDQVSIGPVAVHDAVKFDYHLVILNDSYPHETKEGYAYDGVDIGTAIHWHWGGTRLLTTFQVTPASRTHLAYDQDTDFEPTTDFTHGNEGPAKSRTFAVGQDLPIARFRHAGEIGYEVDFLRQWTRYHQVTTYDLNTNPELPSDEYQRLISEQAILYELRSSLKWSQRRAAGAWELGGGAGVTPLTEIFLHNYIPTVLAATAAEAYGASLDFEAQRHLGRWGVGVRGDAGYYHGYHWVNGFERQQFTLGVQITPPRFW